MKKGVRQATLGLLRFMKNRISTGTHARTIGPIQIIDDNLMSILDGFRQHVRHNEARQSQGAPHGAAQWKMEGLLPLSLIIQSYTQRQLELPFHFVGAS
jgi:hypothetical protein